MAIGAILAEGCHNLADDHVVELGEPTIAVQAQPDRHLDHPGDGLSIWRDQTSDRSMATAIKPQPQHFTDFEHGDLPECHMHRLSGRQT